MSYLYLVGSLVWSIGGAAALIWALSSWLGKVWANRILEQDRKKYAEEMEAVKEKHAANLSRLSGELEAMNRRLQADLDKTVHVHRVQFETEFKGLVEIWRSACAVRSAIMGLRLQTNYSEAAFSDRCKDFAQKLQSLKTAVDDHSPFYAPEVFDKADALIRIGVHEELACSLNDPRNGEIG